MNKKLENQTLEKKAHRVMEDSTRLVSVVITTYKRPRTLSRAIESVLNQKKIERSALEIIVVDDNNDGDPFRLETQSLMKRYSNTSCVRYVKHSTNRNGAAARNSGIQVATGQYITFLDDDDTFTPYRLRTMLDRLMSQPHYQGAYSGYARCRGDRIVRIQRGVEEPDGILELLSQRSFIGTGSNFICTTASVRSIGGFDEAFERHQDIEFLVRFLDHFKMLHVEEVLVVKYEDQAMNLPQILRMEHVKKLFLSKFKYMIDRYGAVDRAEIYRANYRELAQIAFRSNSQLSSWAESGVSKYGGFGRRDCIYQRLGRAQERFPQLRKLHTYLLSTYVKVSDFSEAACLYSVIRYQNSCQ